MRQINASLEQQSTQDLEKIETLTKEIKSAVAEADSVKKSLHAAEESLKKLESQISQVFIFR